MTQDLYYVRFVVAADPQTKDDFCVSCGKLFKPNDKACIATKSEGDMDLYHSTEDDLIWCLDCSPYKRTCACSVDSAAAKED